MIRYTLSCDQGHRFDSWFHDSAAYEDLSGAGRLSCPTCSSTSVEKAIMAPALATSRRAVSTAGEREPPAAPDLPGALLGDREKAMRTFLRAVREKVLAEGQNVGTAFPEQARRMHEGDIPVRQIHGQATPGEARSLIEDGIMILPVPNVPEELN